MIVRHVDGYHVRVAMQTHDPIGQLVGSQELRLNADGTWRMPPSVKRYVPLPELDLMGRLAGLSVVFGPGTDGNAGQPWDATSGTNARSYPL